MRFTISTAGAATILVACTPSPTPVPPARDVPSTEQMAECAVATYMNRFRSSIESYWAPETFGEIGGFKAKWYSSQLCAMGEPTLAPRRGAVRVRFLWLRSFDPGIAVRVEHGTDSTTVHATELSGKGGYEPGRVAKTLERSLSPDEWSDVQRGIEEIRFWALPTNVPSMGQDGSQWILEVANGSRFHVVDRWSGGELQSLGERILALSGLEPEHIY